MFSAKLSELVSYLFLASLVLVLAKAVIQYYSPHKSVISYMVTLWNLVISGFGAWYVGVLLFVLYAKTLHGIPPLAVPFAKFIAGYIIFASLVAIVAHLLGILLFPKAHRLN